MTSDTIQIQAFSENTDLPLVRALFTEYAGSLNIDLCFQNFDAELDALPGDYAPPRGTLVLARSGSELVGCCAMRPLDAADYPNACEMKRLYVRPVLRGSGVGRRLAEAVMEAAQQAGYATMLLDTLSEMETARAMYQDLGFTEVPPYYYNPIEGAHYLMARL
ncbi:GNAT family N-acetyltransferase [Rhodoferax sp.]|jgi:ribosomal protein S18 acetylase RimI-like enzyme|uniref:GNAT family N-acetyltransferase n=1 Tax=Rhodoferax sp. TaxID=50421 RepID=UPI002717B1E6|nr:GNAT family N-acetyltransferase [Rhodoferax sp.]MDO9144852.1 GNAT family N-acetyltransferase [Rhodoferax sp.]MDP1529801.1 GNAT family N-acetyltransferase [Rhodoferax sp.]MDP1943858.1 GNAT family N-acetyltransferase [Rhodoferax sp.]MDP2442826.1 GNAT family N-acetyltransferase [Rhodoferax sp.]MDP3865508.1 GNAT family N-acetyltransferase [Rhodoferax sp.]